MEQARYWMWTKRKNSLSSPVVASTNPSYGDSWEEQAFAEDAASPLGGCVWPPRSYTCSFCRREFRSAQALGGHMNVHRRDRAILKQSPSPNIEMLHHNHFLNQPPSQICNLVYNPNSESDQGFVLSPSRVLVPPTQTQVNCDEKTLVPPFSSPPSWSTLVADKYFNAADLEKEDKNSRILDSSCNKGKRDCLAADLSVSLNFIVCRKNETEAGEKEEGMSCKRRRTDASLSFFPKKTSVDRNHSQLEVVELSPGLVEDLDLELRLGDRPKVK